MREANTFDLSLLILLAIIWGSSFFNIKIATYSYDPITLALVRVIFASVPLLILCKYKKIKVKEPTGEYFKKTVKKENGKKKNGEIKYKNEIYENIKKSKVINHVCTLTKETLELKNNDHIPLNNDILILSVSQKDSHVLEKIINDY